VPITGGSRLFRRAAPASCDDSSGPDSHLLLSGLRPLEVSGDTEGPVPPRAAAMDVAGAASTGRSRRSRGRTRHEWNSRVYLNGAFRVRGETVLLWGFQSATGRVRFVRPRLRHRPYGGIHCLTPFRFTPVSFSIQSIAARRPADARAATSGPERRYTAGRLP